MKAKTVYSKVLMDTGNYMRVVGVLNEAQGMVWVWKSNGPAIGGYKLSRFEDGKLTARTLRNLLSGATPQRPTT